MIQDTQTIRYYQKLTDSLTEMWQRGYRLDDLRLYAEGYITAFRHTGAIEIPQVNHLEEEVNLFLFEIINIPNLAPQTQTQTY